MSEIAWTNMLGLKSLAVDFWIIPIGMLALFFYGRFHFNTPDYALSGNPGVAAGGLIRDLPMARLRGLAPPIYTTTRARYRRYVLRYVAILEAGFVIAIAAPELVTYAIQLKAGNNAGFTMPKDVDQRAIWALFVLTGFLSSFPLVKELDSWLLKQLHKNAIIPDGAEMTAETLFDADYKPRPEIAEEVIKNIQSEHLRRVALGLKSGSLESHWYNLRCVTIATKHLIRNERNIEIRRLFRDDFAEIEDAVTQLRERVIEFLEEQDAIVPQGYEDIDNIYKDRGNDPALKRLHLHRTRLEIEIQALRFRACRLCALITFASETQPEAMSKTLKALGFQVDIYNVPGWHWDAIAKVALAIFIAIIVPSLLYGIVVHKYSSYIPAQMVELIPNDPLAVAMWGLEGTALHIVGLLVALKVKRHYARRHLEGYPADGPEALIVSLIAYGVILPLQCLMAFLNGIPVWQGFFWAILPTVTAAYASKYIDKSRSGKMMSARRSSRQALVMAMCSILVSSTVLLQDFDFEAISPSVWIFFLYGIIVTALIGYTFGQVFQRTYSHCGYTDELLTGIKLLQDKDKKVIGDILVGKSVLSANPMTS